MERVLLYTAVVYIPVVCLTLLAYAKRIKVMRWIFKSLLIPSLIGLYCLAAPQPNLWVLLALGFGWLGDVFLLGRHHWNLGGGMTAFALGHIAYIVGMLSTRPGLHLIAALSVAWIVLWLIGVRRFLIPYAPKRLRLPGLCYAALLAGTCGTALYLACLSGFTAAYVLCFFGGILFMVSDSLLAYDKFGKKTRLGGFFVMATYILAQTALTVGFVLHGGI